MRLETTTGGEDRLNHCSRRGGQQTPMHGAKKVICCRMWYHRTEYQSSPSPTSSNFSFPPLNQIGNAPSGLLPWRSYAILKHVPNVRTWHATQNRMGQLMRQISEASGLRHLLIFPDQVYLEEFLFCILKKAGCCNYMACSRSLLRSLLGALFQDFRLVSFSFVCFRLFSLFALVFV